MTPNRSKTTAAGAGTGAADFIRIILSLPELPVSSHERTASSWCGYPAVVFTDARPAPAVLASWPTPLEPAPRLAAATGLASAAWRQVSAILALTSLATAASSATSAVSWGHQASATEHGGRSRIGTNRTPGRLYHWPTASEVMLRPAPVETRWVSASRVEASATTGAGPDR